MDFHAVSKNGFYLESPLEEKSYSLPENEAKSQLNSHHKLAPVRTWVPLDRMDYNSQTIFHESQLAARVGGIQIWRKNRLRCPF